MPLAGEKDFAGCVTKMKSNEGLSDEAAKKKCAEEMKNTLSPSIKDLKEVHIEEPMVKAWNFDPDSILKSSRKVTGTFHVPKIDKDREIITKAAMTDAIPDFMHLPILHDFHKERVLGLVTKVWEEADAFHFEALFKATHDVDDAWDKVSKGQYDHVSIYGSRLQGSASCGLDPSQRAIPCISNKIRLDSISACDDAARNDASSLKLAKGFVIESEDGEITFRKAETSEGGLIHGTQDGVKKKGGNMRVREVDEDDDRYKDDKEEKKAIDPKSAYAPKKHTLKDYDETTRDTISMKKDRESQNRSHRNFEYEKAEAEDEEESPVVTKGDYDINGMFNRILDVLHKLVNSDKKVHSEMDKAEIDKDEDEESPVVTKGPEKRFQKGSELDWMKDKEDTQAKQRKEGVPQKERESFSQTNRFVNKGARPGMVPDLDDSGKGTSRDNALEQEGMGMGRSSYERNQAKQNQHVERSTGHIQQKCASSCMKKGDEKPKELNEEDKKYIAHGTQGALGRMHERIWPDKHPDKVQKSGENMAEEVKEEIKKAEVPEVKPEVKEMTDEEFVQNIVKAKLDDQTKTLQEFMKAHTDEIRKAVEKLAAMEERMKKVEEQPIQKAAVVISEQLKPMEGYGSLNYKAINRG